MDWERASELTLDKFMQARADSAEDKALRQYEAHLAYYASTRLLLVRVWEDLQLLEPVLYDGGFKHSMTSLKRHRGGSRPLLSASRSPLPLFSLFAHQNSYTWYRPQRDALVEAIYRVSQHVPGPDRVRHSRRRVRAVVERIDRKLLGQYYTRGTLSG